MALKQFKKADGTSTTTTPSFFQTATGIAVSVGVLFLTVWVISKAWKSGQKQA
jgi:hypothetical protein